MAINPWVGYEASAYVVGQVAANELGCTVEYKNLKEEVAWQGFGSGQVDVVIENWGHEDLKEKYIEDQGTAVRVGPTATSGSSAGTSRRGWPRSTPTSPTGRTSTSTRRVPDFGIRRPGPAARR
jgi:hypothetical protein